MLFCTRAKTMQCFSPTMLFFMLGGIYLISSLSWLFIDCTKTLADEAGEEADAQENEQVPEE